MPVGIRNWNFGKKISAVQRNMAVAKHLLKVDSSNEVLYVVPVSYCKAVMLGLIQIRSHFLQAKTIMCHWVKCI